MAEPEDVRFIAGLCFDPKKLIVINGSLVASIATRRKAATFSGLLELGVRRAAEAKFRGAEEKGRYIDSFNKLIDTAPLTVADEIYSQLNEANFKSWLLHEYKPKRVTNSGATCALKCLQQHHGVKLATTNYDTFVLETARATRGPEVPRSNRTLNVVDENHYDDVEGVIGGDRQQQAILHLFGVSPFSHRECIIFTSRDHENYLSHKAVHADHLNCLFYNSHVLFVGFSKNDPFLQTLYMFLKQKTKGRWKNRHYILVPDDDLQGFNKEFPGILPIRYGSTPEDLMHSLDMVVETTEDHKSRGLKRRKDDIDEDTFPEVKCRIYFVSERDGAMQQLGGVVCRLGIPREDISLGEDIGPFAEDIGPFASIYFTLDLPNQYVPLLWQLAQIKQNELVRCGIMAIQIETGPMLWMIYPQLLADLHGGLRGEHDPPGAVGQDGDEQRWEKVRRRKKHWEQLPPPRRNDILLAVKISVYGHPNPKHHISDLKARIINHFRCKVVYKWSNRNPCVVTFHCQGEKQEVERAIKFVKRNEQGNSQFYRGYPREKQLRQFACEDCDVVWWALVPKDHPVTLCPECQVCYNALRWGDRYGYGEFKCGCGTHFVCKDRFLLWKQFQCPSCMKEITPDRIRPPHRKPEESEARYQSIIITGPGGNKSRKPKSSHLKVPQPSQLPKPQMDEPENTEISQSAKEIISTIRRYSQEAAATSAPAGKRDRMSKSKEEEEAQSQSIQNTDQPKQTIRMMSKPDNIPLADDLTFKNDPKTPSAVGESKPPAINNPALTKSKHQIKKERELQRKTKKKKVHKETKRKRNKSSANTAQNEGAKNVPGDASKQSPTTSRLQVALSQPCIEIPAMPESKPPQVNESLSSISGHMHCGNFKCSEHGEEDQKSSEHRSQSEAIISSSASCLPTEETSQSAESAFKTHGIQHQLLPVEEIVHVVVSTPTMENIPQDQPLQQATAPGSSDTPSCMSSKNDLMQQAKKIVCRALLKAILNYSTPAIETDLASPQINDESLTADATTNSDTHTSTKEHRLHTGVEQFSVDIPAVSSETDMQPTFHMPVVSPIDKVTPYERSAAKSDQETSYSDGVLDSSVAHLAVNADSTDAISSETSHQVQSVQSENQKQQQLLGNEFLPHENTSIPVPSTQGNIHESDAGNDEVTGSIQTNTTHYVSPITHNQHSFTAKPETESPLQVVKDALLASEQNDISDKHDLDQQQINTEDHHICADTEVGTTDLKSHQACVTDSSSPDLHSKLVAAIGTINHEFATQAPSMVYPDVGKRSEETDLNIPGNEIVDQTPQVMSSYSTTESALHQDAEVHQTSEAAGLDFECSKWKNADAANSDLINSSLDTAQSSVQSPTLGDHSGLRDQQARVEDEAAPSASNPPTVHKETVSNETPAQEQALQQLPTTIEGCRKASKVLPSTLEDPKLTEPFAHPQSSQEGNTENLSQTSCEDVPPNRSGGSASPDHSGTATLPPEVDSTTPITSESQNADTKFTQQAEEEDRGEAMKESEFDRPELLQAIRTEELCDEIEPQTHKHLSEKDKPSDVEPEHDVVHNLLISGTSSHVLQSTDSSNKGQSAVTSTEEDQEILGTKRGDSAKAEFAAVKISNRIQNSRPRGLLRASECEDTKTDSTVQAEESEIIDPANESDDALNLATSTEMQPENKAYFHTHEAYDTDESRYQPASDEVLCDSLSGNLTSSNLDLLNDHVPTGPPVPVGTTTNEETQIPFITTDAEGQKVPLEEQGSKLHQISASRRPETRKNHTMVRGPNDSETMKRGTNVSELVDSDLKERPSAESDSYLLKSTRSEADTPTSVHTSEEVDITFQEEQPTPAHTSDFDHKNAESDGIAITEASCTSLQKQLPHGSAQIAQVSTVTRSNSDGNTDVVYDGKLPDLEQNQAQVQSLLHKDSEEASTTSAEPIPDTQTAPTLPQVEAGSLLDSKLEKGNENRFSAPDSFPLDKLNQMLQDDHLPSEEIPETKISGSLSIEVTPKTKETTGVESAKPLVDNQENIFAIVLAILEDLVTSVTIAGSTTATSGAVSTSNTPPENLGDTSGLTSTSTSEAKSGENIQETMGGDQDGEPPHSLVESDWDEDYVPSEEEEEDLAIEPRKKGGPFHSESVPGHTETKVNSISMLPAQSKSLVTENWQEQDWPQVPTDRAPDKGTARLTELTKASMLEKDQRYDQEIYLPQLPSDPINPATTSGVKSDETMCSKQEVPPMEKEYKEVEDDGGADSKQGELKSQRGDQDGEPPHSIVESDWDEDYVPSEEEEEDLAIKPRKKLGPSHSELGPGHTEDEGDLNSIVKLSASKSLGTENDMQSEPSSPQGEHNTSKQEVPPMEKEHREVTDDDRDDSKQIESQGGNQDGEPPHSIVESDWDEDYVPSEEDEEDLAIKPRKKGGPFHSESVPGHTETKVNSISMLPAQSKSLVTENWQEQDWPQVPTDWAPDKGTARLTVLAKASMLEKDQRYDQDIYLPQLPSDPINPATTSGVKSDETMCSKQEVPPMEKEHREVEDDDRADSKQIESQRGDQDGEPPHSIVESDWDEDYVPSEEEEEDLAIKPRKKGGPSHSELGPGHTEDEGDLNSIVKLSASKSLGTENDVQSEPSSPQGEHNTSKQEVPPMEKEHREVEDDDRADSKQIESQRGDQDGEPPHSIVESDWDEDYVPSEEEEEDLAIKPRKKLGPSHSELGPGHTETKVNSISMLPAQSKSLVTESWQQQDWPQVPTVDRAPDKGTARLAVLAKASMLEKDQRYDQEIYLPQLPSDPINPATTSGVKSDETMCSKQEVPPMEKERREVEDDDRADSKQIESQRGDQDGEPPHSIVESDWDEDYVPSEEEEEDLAIKPRKKLGPFHSELGPGHTEDEGDLNSIVKLSASKSLGTENDVQSEPSSPQGERNTSKQEVPPMEKEHREVTDDDRDDSKQGELKSQRGDQDGEPPHSIVESDWDEDYVPSEEEEEDLAIKPRKKLGPSHSELGPGHTETKVNSISMLPAQSKSLVTENWQEQDWPQVPTDRAPDKGTARLTELAKASMLEKDQRYDQEIYLPQLPSDPINPATTSAVKSDETMCSKLPPMEKEYKEVEDDGGADSKQIESQRGDQDGEPPHSIVESDWDEDYVPSEEEEEDLAIKPRKKGGLSHSELGPGHTEDEGDLNSIVKLSASKSLGTENDVQSEPSSPQGERNTSKQEVPPMEKEHREVTDDDRDDSKQIESQGGDQDSEPPHSIVESDWDEDYVPSEEDEEDLAIKPRKKGGPSHSELGPGHTEDEGDLNSIVKLSASKSLGTENDVQSEPSSPQGEHNTSKQEVPPMEKEHREVTDDDRDDSKQIESQGGDQDSEPPHSIVESDWDEDYVSSDEEEEDLAIEPRKRLGLSQSSTEYEDDSILKLPGNKSDESRQELGMQEGPTDEAPNKRTVNPKQEAEGYDQENEALSDASYSESEWDEDYEASEEEEEEEEEERRRRRRRRRRRGGEETEEMEEEEEEEEEDLATESHRSLTSTRSKWKPGQAEGVDDSTLRLQQTRQENTQYQPKQEAKYGKAILQYSNQGYVRDVYSQSQKREKTKFLPKYKANASIQRNVLIPSKRHKCTGDTDDETRNAGLQARPVVYEFVEEIYYIYKSR